MKNEPVAIPVATVSDVEERLAQMERERKREKKGRDILCAHQVTALLLLGVILLLPVSDDTKRGLILGMACLAGASLVVCTCVFVR